MAQAECDIGGGRHVDFTAERQVVTREPHRRRRVRRDLPTLAPRQDALPQDSMARERQPSVIDGRASIRGQPSAIDGRASIRGRQSTTGPPIVTDTPAARWARHLCSSDGKKAKNAMKEVEQLVSTSTSTSTSTSSSPFPIPVIGSIAARGTQRLNCSMHGSMAVHIQPLSAACYGTHCQN